MEGGIEGRRVQQVGVRARVACRGFGLQVDQRAMLVQQRDRSEAGKCRAVLEPDMSGPRIDRLGVDRRGRLGRVDIRPRRRRDARQVGDSAAYVLAPVRSRLAVAAVDLEHEVVGRQPEQGLAQTAVVEDERPDDLEILDLQGVRLQPLRSGGEAHLDEAGRREHDRAIDPVVGEIGDGRRVQVGGPDGNLRPRTEAEQRVIRAGADQVPRFRRRRRSQRPSLPRIGGQGDVRRVEREEPALVDRAARRENARDDAAHRVVALVGALEAADGVARHTGLPETFVDVAEQDRIGADLEEETRAALDQRVDRIAEAHGLAHVPPPILGGERPSIHLDRIDGRDHWEDGRARVQVGQVVEQRRAHRLHQIAVERVVQIEPAQRPAALPRRLRERRDQRGGTRQRDRPRRVDGRQRQPVPAGVGERGGGLFGRNLKRRHPARAVGKLLVPAAREDHTGRLVERQRARDMGGGHLPDAVSDHRGRRDPVRPQGLGQRHLDGEQQGLGELGATQPLLQVIRPQRLDQ